MTFVILVNGKAIAQFENFDEVISFTGKLTTNNWKMLEVDEPYMIEHDWNDLLN